jgi:hypothetical protein
MARNFLDARLLAADASRQEAADDGLKLEGPAQLALKARQQHPGAESGVISQEDAWIEILSHRTAAPRISRLADRKAWNELYEAAQWSRSRRPETYIEAMMRAFIDSYSVSVIRPCACNSLACRSRPAMSSRPMDAAVNRLDGASAVAPMAGG